MIAGLVAAKCESIESSFSSRLTESAGADSIALFKRVGVRSMEININFQFSIAATERKIHDKPMANETG